MSPTRPISLLSLLLSLIPAHAFAQSSPPTTPVQSSPPTAESLSKEPYVFELLQNKIRFEADGKGQREFTIRVRVQSQSAVRELGLLVYPFASSFESLDVVYARVRKPDGTTVETPPSDVQELDSAVSREAPMYTDEREKHVAIKSLSVGDVLEAQFRWTIHDPVAPGHFWFDANHFKNGICLKEHIEIDVPRATPVKIHSSGPQPIVRDEGDRRIYTFDSANLKKPTESKIPAWEKDVHGAAPPDIRVASFTSWEDVGAWFSALEKSPALPTPEIRAKAEELTRGKATDDEKIRALYDFVSTHFRYIGVSLGQGRYAPHSAADVLSNRYGDCKDKHTLFQALLQSVGIPAYPVLIGSQFRVDDALPSPSTFDHVITAIPLGDKLQFLDTTPEVAPFGLLLTTLRDRQALVMPSGKPAILVTTPADPPFKSYESFHTDSTLDKQGTLDAKMTLEERGDGEILMRSAYRATPQNQWDVLTQKLVNGMGFGGTVSDVLVSPPEDTAKPFTLSFTYHRTEFPDWKNRRVVLPAPAIFLAELNEEQKQSKDPFPLGALEEITYDSTVKLPPGFSAIKPDDLHRTSNFADFDATYSLDQPNVLHGVLHFKSKLREVPGEDRSKFSALADTVGETARRYIFVKGDFPDQRLFGGLLTSLSQPIAERITSMEKTLADDPTNHVVQFALGSTYIDAGRPNDAVVLLEKSITKNPTAIASYYFLLGEAYVSVSEPDKALAAFQKALGDSPTAAQLNNTAYELGDAGLKLQEAQGYARRALKEIASQTSTISPGEAQMVDFARMPELASAWDTVGWLHFRSNDGFSAKGYIESAWELSQSPAIGEHLVEIYERLNQPEKAAKICAMALAGPAPNKIREKLAAQNERLRKYLKPATGQPAPHAPVFDGAMALSDFRTLPVPFHPKLRGKSALAHFTIGIPSYPRTNNAFFTSGDPELRPAASDIAALKLPQSFADDTPIRIIRKATLSCSIYTKNCILILMPVADAAVPER